MKAVLALSTVLACSVALAQAPTIVTSLGTLAVTHAEIDDRWPPGCSTASMDCQTGRFLVVSVAMQSGGVIPGGVIAVLDASSGAYVQSDTGATWVRFAAEGPDPATSVDIAFHAGSDDKTFRLFWPGNPPVDLTPLFQSPMTVSSVVNGASFLPGIASGSWISVMGTNLCGTARVWGGSDFKNGALPLSLDGVNVKVNNKDAPIGYVSPTQINVLAPADSATGTIAVTVNSPNGTITAHTTLQHVAPAWFAFSQKGGVYPAAVHSNGSYIGPTDLFGGSAVAVPARPNETILLFGTGFGPTNPDVDPLKLFSGAAPLATPNDLRVTVGGKNAKIEFAGLVVNGEDQINIVVPNLPDGEHDLIATIGGMHTQTLRLAVEAPPAAACTSNCKITTSVGTFAVTNAQIGDSFPIGCAPGPGCFEAEPGFEVVAVTLELRGSLKGSFLDLLNPNAYVLAEDGSKAPVSAAGLQSGNYFIACTPKDKLRDFVLYWPGNTPVDLTQFVH